MVGRVNWQERLIPRTIIRLVKFGLAVLLYVFLFCPWEESASPPKTHQYVLTDFKDHSGADPVRLIFAYAKVTYTDHRIEDTEWPSLKSKTPFGQLPVLDIDNGQVVLTQSNFIASYLGRQLHLTPESQMQAARGDVLAGKYVEDVQKHLVPWFQEKDPAKKKEIWQQLEKDQLAPFLSLYEKFLKEHKTKYFLSNSITWTDLFLFDALHKMRTASPHLFHSHPKLNEFVNSIKKEPKIHAWLEKRPTSDF